MLRNASLRLWSLTTLVSIVTSGDVIILRRRDGSVDFRQPWDNYTVGFGAPREAGEFWLGLEPIHALTRTGSYKLRVDMTTWANERTWAEYSEFVVVPRSDYFRLRVSGYNRASTAGDSLVSGLYMEFSTYDADRDAACHVHCAEVMRCGWWYHSCGLANPTGLYLSSRATARNGVTWFRNTGRWRSFREMTFTLVPK